uniref:Taste 1 receptor member 1 n=1 Tax=Strigops habroptila TaxID=2489341 RepID=A0A672V445_STRHB
WRRPACPLPALLCLCAAAAAAAASGSRGDYRLAGLFQLHGPLPPSNILRFAVEEINNSSTLLPNVTLAYDIHDACSDLATSTPRCSPSHRGEGRRSRCSPPSAAMSPAWWLSSPQPSFSWLPLQISYEASLGDGQQVKAIFQLLQHFGWTWVGWLRKALYNLISASEVCIALPSTIPTNKDANSPELQSLVKMLIEAKVNVTIVFLHRQTQAVWQVPGIQSIGSVIGITEAGEVIEKSTQPNCTQCCTGCRWLAAAHSVYDAQSSFRLYSAVYAVAHGLHDLLGCASGTCIKGPVYPWKLLQKIKQVNFTLYNNHISFDASGDIRKGYDIIMWNWSGPSWSFAQWGVPLPAPLACLTLPCSRQAPSSVCTGPCQPGERRLHWNRHRCCFNCMACPPGTFLNTSDPYSCQHCELEEWSPERSEVCFNRTVEFLSWSEPMSWALLTPTVLLMLLMAGLAILFALNASTPVVKSAGGNMCFLMLGALACACSSLFGYFGEPTRHMCLLRHPLYAISLTIFLSCVATRSFQIVCIFKLNARCPALYEAWMRRRGPVLFVAANTLAQAVLCLALEAANPSLPHRNYRIRATRVVLECAPSSAVRQATTAYTVLLSACCFALSYAGKDLPASYNEAKCLTCSLLLHLAGSAVFLCTQDAFSGREQGAVQALSTFCTVAALLAGFFLPKAFVILLRPHRNTPEHFQEAIQSYTRRLAAA